MTRIKAVISDFDGTLYSHTLGCIPESCVKAQQALADLGIPVYVATGRSLESVEKTLLKCGQMRSLHPGVYHDGSVYCDMQGVQHVIATFETSLCRKVVDLLMAGRSAGMQVNVSIQGLKWLYLMDRGLKDKGRSLAEDYMGTDYRCVNSIDEILDIYDDCIMCLMISSDNEEAVEATQRVLRMAVPNLPKFLGGHPAIAVLNNGTQKVDGVKAFCKNLDLNFDEILVVGDGDNDISMLDFFPHSVAMGNACEEARNVAKRIAPKCEDDGWAAGVVPFIEQINAAKP